MINFKIGIDGGGGFLKICLNIRRQIEDTSTRCRLYKDCIEGAAYVDTSVHKLLILAIAPEALEYYENVSKYGK